jgi:hypothetical protein
MRCRGGEEGEGKIQLNNADGSFLMVGKGGSEQGKKNLKVLSRSVGQQ